MPAPCSRPGGATTTKAGHTRSSDGWRPGNMPEPSPDRPATALRSLGPPRGRLLPPNSMKAQITKGLSLWLDAKRGSRQANFSTALDLSLLASLSTCTAFAAASWVTVGVCDDACALTPNYRARAVTIVTRAIGVVVILYLLDCACRLAGKAVTPPVSALPAFACRSLHADVDLVDFAGERVVAFLVGERHIGFVVHTDA